MHFLIGSHGRGLEPWLPSYCGRWTTNGGAKTDGCTAPECRCCFALHFASSIVTYDKSRGSSLRHNFFFWNMTAAPSSIDSSGLVNLEQLRLTLEHTEYEHALNAYEICTFIERWSNVRPSRCSNTTRFDSIRVPEIKVGEYLLHFLVHTKVPFKEMNIHLYHAIVYACRYLYGNDVSFHLNPFNVHRLFVAALIVTRKILDDQAPQNVWFYAGHSGLTVRDCKLCEIELFTHVHLFVDIDSCQRAKHSFMSMAHAF